MVVDCVYEYWGDSVPNFVADPNPQLVALIAAEREDARVRVLLDRLFDDARDQRGNRATADCLNALLRLNGRS